MEINLKLNRRNKMRTQLTHSSGNAWMVSSYNAWQQRSPLGTLHKRDSKYFLRVVSRNTPSVSTGESIVLSLKVMVLISGFIMSGIVI